MSSFFSTYFNSEGLMPHIHCYLDRAPLVWSMVITDGLIAASYLFISFALVHLAIRVRLPFHAIFYAFGILVLACAATHGMEVYNLWVPNYWLTVGVKTVTAIASVVTAILCFLIRDDVMSTAEAARLSSADRTAKQEADVQFKRSETFLNSILENIPNMVFVKDAKNLKFVRFNRAGEVLLGQPRNVLIGKSDRDFFPEAQAEHFIRSDRAVLAGKSVVDIPEEIIQTQSGERFLHTRKIPVFLDGQAQADYLLGISEDITEWKIAQEEKLKVFGEKIAVEERERATIRSGLLADITTALAKSFDYPANLNASAEILARTLCDYCNIILQDDDGVIERVAAVHRKAGSQERVRRFMTDVPLSMVGEHPFSRVIRTGETIHMALVEEEDIVRMSEGNEKHEKLLAELGCRSLIVVPIKIKERIYGAIGIVSSSADIIYGSQDVALAEEIAGRAGNAIENAKLYEAVRKAVQSRDEFLSIASHELKTPLTALKLQVEFARRLVKVEENELPPAEKMAKMLDTSSAQINRLSALVDDLLDVSRIEAGKLNFSFEKVDLAVIAKDVAERYREHVTSLGSTFSVRIPEMGLFVKGDRFRLEQVILNVLSNATKYGLNRPIELRVLRNLQTRQIELQCQDHGIGIPSAKMEKIFERFERAIESSHISGLGLGLYIAKEIVLAHQGTIRADCTLNQGSTFIVEIPEYEEDS